MIGEKSRRCQEKAKRKNVYSVLRHMQRKCNIKLAGHHFPDAPTFHVDMSGVEM